MAIANEERKKDLAYNIGSLLSTYEPKLLESFIRTNEKSELANLFSLLENNPTTGTPLGNDIYKIRLAIASKNKGRSGGARVISFVQVTDTTVLLFSIYSKGDKDSISDKEIEELLKDYL